MEGWVEHALEKLRVRISNLEDKTREIEQDVYRLQDKVRDLERQVERGYR